MRRSRVIMWVARRTAYDEAAPSPARREESARRRGEGARMRRANPASQAASKPANQHASLPATLPIISGNGGAGGVLTPMLSTMPTPPMGDHPHAERPPHSTNGRSPPWWARTPPPPKWIGGRGCPRPDLQTPNTKRYPPKATRPPPTKALWSRRVHMCPATDGARGAVFDASRSG